LPCLRDLICFSLKEQCHTEHIYCHTQQNIVRYFQNCPKHSKQYGANGVAKPPSLHQLRSGAVALFKRYDKNGSGSIELDEMKTLLRALGKDITVQDIKKYIEIGRGFQKVDKQNSSLIAGSNDPSSHSPESSLSHHAKGGQTGTAEQSEGLRTQLYKSMSQMFENDSDDYDLENLTLTQPEFVRVIEGIVLDEDSGDESDDEDMSTIPQKRHVIAVGGYFFFFNS